MKEQVSGRREIAIDVAFKIVEKVAGKQEIGMEFYRRKCEKRNSLRYFQ